MGTVQGRDLAQVFFSLIVLALLMGGSLYILMPFMPALVWSTMIVVSTWPLMLGLQRLLRGSRGLATTVMLGAMLMIILLPIFTAVVSIAKNGALVREKVQTLQTSDLPRPPAWVGKVPVVGDKVVREWNTVVDEGADRLKARMMPYLRRFLAWITAKAGSLGMLGVHLLLTVGLSGILYMKGEAAAGGVIRFARRLTPERGEATVVLAGQAIRSVAMGIVVTALVQALLGGLGLFLCQVPGAGVLTGVMFLLTIAQLGPLLVLAPAVGWLFWAGHTGWAVTLLVISIVVVALDNVLRPILIKRGADLPLLLILAGVMGGLLSFGLIGLFVGPGLLAVAYTLLDVWLAEADEK